MKKQPDTERMRERLQSIIDQLKPLFYTLYGQGRIPEAKQTITVALALHDIIKGL